MKFRVVTIEGIKIDEEVSGVTLPTGGGPIQVFSGHAPAVVTLKEGSIRFDGSEYKIVSGAAKIESDKIVVFEGLSAGLWLD